MKFEIRHVHKDWVHPRDADGLYIPLLNGYARAVDRWDIACELWSNGLRREYGIRESEDRLVTRDLNKPDEAGSYAEWARPRPIPEDFMPDWPEKERTHFQLYEATTEGTPCSPVLSSIAEIKMHRQQ